MSSLPGSEPAPLPISFPFRPWVRRRCRRALLWGLVILAALAAAVWWLRGPTGWAWDRAVGSLLAYSLLFWASLAKIWWTAGKPAVGLTGDALFYQPLWAFRPRHLPYARIVAASPRPGTSSLGLLVERRGAAHELFLNLAVIEGGGELLARLGERLEAAGLLPLSDAKSSWARSGWAEGSGAWTAGAEGSRRAERQRARRDTVP